MTIIAMQAQDSVGGVEPLLRSLYLVRYGHLHLDTQPCFCSCSSESNTCAKPALMMAEHTEPAAMKPGPPQMSDHALT